jgi:hypothetical protein
MTSSKSWIVRYAEARNLHRIICAYPPSDEARLRPKQIESPVTRALKRYLPVGLRPVITVEKPYKEPARAAHKNAVTNH